MKFLEIDSLDALNSIFEWETTECILNGRIEAYSCKYSPEGTRHCHASSHCCNGRQIGWFRQEAL